MARKKRQLLEKPAVQAAEAALAGHGYVSSIDIFTGMRLLQPPQVDSWPKRRVDSGESLIEGISTKSRSPCPSSGTGHSTEGCAQVKPATPRWLPRAAAWQGASHAGAE